MKDSARCISENFTATSHYAGLCITLEMQNADVDWDKELCKEHSWLNRQRAPWRKFRAPKLKQKKLLSGQHALDWLCARAVDAKINFDRLGGQKVAGTKLAWEKRFEGVWMRDWVGGKKVASAKIGPKKVGGIRCLIDLVRKSVQCCGSAQRALNLCTSHELLHFCATLHHAALHCTTALYIVLINIDHCTLHHCCFHSVQ